MRTILTTLAIILISLSANADGTKIFFKNGGVVTVKTVCIDGYKYNIAYSGDHNGKGLSITQT
jgi:hypothetical protein